MGSEWRGYVFVIALAGASGAAGAQNVLVSGIQFESSGLVAPVAVYTARRDATEWRAGVTGWTVGGSWTRTLAPTRSIAVALDVTPVNSHSSNKLYAGGIEDPALAYRNATVQLGVGVRWFPSSRWTTDARGVVLYERVSDLSADLLGFWRSPFVGVDVTQRYDRISADDVIRSRFEGVRVSLRTQVYTGTSSWGRGTLSFGAGQRVGRLFVRANGFGAYGRSLNTVSAFLTSGSWDAAGPTALYGYAHGALRLDRGALVNGGVDFRLRGATEIGVRSAWLTSPRETRHGLGLSVSTLWNGIGMNVVFAAPEGDALAGRWNRAVVAGGITAVLFR